LAFKKGEVVRKQSVKERGKGEGHLPIRKVGPFCSRGGRVGSDKGAKKHFVGGRGTHRPVLSEGEERVGDFDGGGGRGRKSGEQIESVSGGQDTAPNVIKEFARK